MVKAEIRCCGRIHTKYSCVQSVGCCQSWVEVMDLYILYRFVTKSKVLWSVLWLSLCSFFHIFSFKTSGHYIDKLKYWAYLAGVNE